jgi:hypothetical protein
MGKLKWLVWGIVLAAGLALLAAFLLSDQFYGVGFFDQQVVVDSSQPIKKVFFCCCTFNEADRRRLEAMPNPRTLVEWEEPDDFTEGHFTASITYDSISGFFHNRVSYPAHLAVLAEFADGTCACRVVDLPRDQGKERVVVRFGQQMEG